jgi:hypothetical protein
VTLPSLRFCCYTFLYRNIRKTPIRPTLDFPGPIGHIPRAGGVVPLVIHTRGAFPAL